MCNDRQHCTALHPMPKGAAGRWDHAGAAETDYDGDYSAEYKCKDCGHVWREELPE